MLSDTQKRRYARNISLPEIGEAGQLKLLGARVLVIGAGGLGSASISYLAAAGIGHIGIVDYDRVELSNLQRQVLFEQADVGRLKVEAARDRVLELNPQVDVGIYPVRIDAENAAALVGAYDIVADGSDNFATRRAVNRACHNMRKTLVSSAIRAWEGQLAVFRSYLGGEAPCYECFAATAFQDERGCADAGVVGAFAGAMGGFQAIEVIKELLDIGCLSGRLARFNGLSLEARIVKIGRDSTCDCCGGT